MGQKYKSLSIFEFQELFPNEEACMNHLVELKWPDGFKWERCGNRKHCQRSRSYSHQCTKCKYQSSPTSGTLFHKVKFPLLKAFDIIYYMSTSKKYKQHRTKQEAIITSEDLLAFSAKSNESHGE